MFEQDVAA